MIDESKLLEVVPKRGVGLKQPLKDVPGAYLIVHELTQSSYVGSTGSLSHRRAEHFSMLRKGKHTCKPLQQLFDQDPNPDNFKYMCQPTDSRDQAFDLEQSWVGIKKGEGSLLNVAEDVRSSGKGRVQSAETRAKLSSHRKGKPLSPEHAEKQRVQLRAITRTGAANPSARAITVDGVHYETIKNASVALGLEKSLVRQRGLSPNFPNYQLSEK